MNSLFARFRKPASAPEVSLSDETVQLDDSAVKYGTKVDRPVDRLWRWVRQDWWLVAASIYFLAVAVQAVGQNVRAQQELTDLRVELAQIQQERTRLAAELIFVQTKQVQEIALRESQLLIRPGERVFAVPDYAVELGGEDVVLQVGSARPTPEESLKAWVDFVRFRL